MTLVSRSGSQVRWAQWASEKFNIPLADIAAVTFSWGTDDTKQLRASVHSTSPWVFRDDRYQYVFEDLFVDVHYDEDGLNELHRELQELRERSSVHV